MELKPLYPLIALVICVVLLFSFIWFESDAYSGVVWPVFNVLILLVLGIIAIGAFVYYLKSE